MSSGRTATLTVAEYSVLRRQTALAVTVRLLVAWGMLVPVRVAWTAEDEPSGETLAGQLAELEWVAVRTLGRPHAA